MRVVAKSPPKMADIWLILNRSTGILQNEKFNRTLSNKIVRWITQEAKQAQQFSTQLEKKQQQQNITLCHYKANKLTRPLLPAVIPDDDNGKKKPRPIRCMGKGHLILMLMLTALNSD